MKYIKAFTWGWGSRKRDWFKNKAHDSLEKLIERTGINTVVLALGAEQDTPQSIKIDYKGEHMVSDEELDYIIGIIKDKNLDVILKPTVNVKNGTWRAYIDFFDKDVPGEAKWSDWFKSYEEYILYYSELAKKYDCLMFVVGCEMVMAERRENEWRKLINNVKKIYNGNVTYNTDKYQEDTVSWWDAVDVISSSGYYPIDDWDRQLMRIEGVVKKYNKPFLFMETGCMSRKGSALIPNKWDIIGKVDLYEQERYYKVMLEKIKKQQWINGIVFWDWPSTLYDESDVSINGDYCVYGKPAESVIKSFNF